MATKVIRFIPKLAEPLAAREAQKLAREILKTGILAFSGHAKDEMKTDKMQSSDVLNTLRAGWCEEAPERVDGTWRYRFKTNRMCVVLAFRSHRHAVVITAWRDV